MTDLSTVLLVASDVALHSLIRFLSVYATSPVLTPGEPYPSHPSTCTAISSKIKIGKDVKKCCNNNVHRNDQFMIGGNVLLEVIF